MVPTCMIPTHILTHIYAQGYRPTHLSLNVLNIGPMHINCHYFLVLYFTELSGKMANVATLLLVLFGSVVKRSDAVSCYDCQYNSLQPQQTTCTEPFDAESAPKCNGTVCEFTEQSVTKPQSKPIVLCTSHRILFSINDVFLDFVFYK